MSETSGLDVPVPGSGGATLLALELRRAVPGQGLHLEGIKVAGVRDVAYRVIDPFVPPGLGPRTTVRFEVLGDAPVEGDLHLALRGGSTLPIVRDGGTLHAVIPWATNAVPRERAAGETATSPVGAQRVAR